MKSDGHYLSAHSDQHLLYCDWKNRDSLLVSNQEFLTDLKQNYIEMKKFGITKTQTSYFIPPFEWYNTEISNWCREFGLTLVNYTPGTKSHADWTIPDNRDSYVASDSILQSIINYENRQQYGLNGFILISHIGTDPQREDKFYFQLDRLLAGLFKKGYRFKRIDELLQPKLNDSAL